jgi:serine protease inhibitor
MEQLVLKHSFIREFFLHKIEMNDHPKSGIETNPTAKKGKCGVRSRKLTVISLALVSVILISYVALVYYPKIVLNAAYAASDERAFSVDTRLVSANTQFAFNFFRELVAEGTNKNLFISPLSISLALTMIYNGAEGTTRDAMAKTLNFGNMNLEEVSQAYLNLIESLENVDQAVKLLIGNSVWMKSEFEPLVKASFTGRITTWYNGEMFTRDFGNPQTISEINGWVDKSTEGKIQEIIKEIDPELVMLLINAIYFKGEWIVKFDEAATQKQDFFLPEGNPVQVDMMSASGNFSYYSGQNCQVARLPYGRDKIAMYIFLPSEEVPLDSFVANLNQTTHDEYISRLHPIDNLSVNLPKFKVEYGVKRLNTILKKLGMEIAFTPYEANFSGIASTAPGNLYISYVDHKAIVEVNEQGTEAAAVTSVGIGLTSAPPSFVVNRPFFFEIRDDRSGSILFMGKIFSPTGT